MVNAQTSLEKAMKKMCIDINMLSYLIATKNEVPFTVTQVTDENPTPTLAPILGFEYTFGDAFFNAEFGNVNSIIKHKY